MGTESLGARAPHALRARTYTHVSPMAYQSEALRTAGNLQQTLAHADGQRMRARALGWGRADGARASCLVGTVRDGICDAPCEHLHGRALRLSGRRRGRRSASPRSRRPRTTRCHCLCDCIVYCCAGVACLAVLCIIRIVLYYVLNTYYVLSDPAYY